MDPLTFDYGDLHLRVDRGVFELFNLASAEHTFRVPLRWLGALVHYKKPDKPGQLFFGVVRDPSAALYGTDRLAFRFASSPAVQVPPADEMLFRTYFTDVATLADRRMG
ncbi:hypothetical protein G3I60_01885 [Streptomyces sp. SID13666]|uniref:hypothetical protein n=1 Tax=unclassified Streptomyces TaxID=2593676 RepID=UPI0013C01E48|nr:MULTISPECIES: hypothetical protein [unclassified Streptomyces]NEA52958.1 hypothetical protein [Streptomyces sp. SID13666]NEA69715.1 hypothetical protein [Streptomyces sp. SID13588]